MDITPPNDALPNYPRVIDGDKDKILDELRKLVGEKLAVSIIGVAPKEGKLIFSEKGTDDKEKRELVATYQVGDVLEGEVTGMVDFGVFVKVQEGLEGLVHIARPGPGRRRCNSSGPARRSCRKPPTRAAGSIPAPR